MTETANQRFLRVARELRAIERDPTETPERRRKASDALWKLTHGSARGNELVPGNSRGTAFAAQQIEYEG